MNILLFGTFYHPLKIDLIRSDGFCLFVNLPYIFLFRYYPLIRAKIKSAHANGFWFWSDYTRSLSTTKLMTEFGLKEKQFLLLLAAAKLEIGYWSVVKR